ncbi:MAG TPA: VOC family protein [Acidimicrobiales bacterium]
MQVNGLSYIGVNATDPSAWTRYATEILGLAPADDDGDADLRFRMDERSWRLAVHRAEWPGLAYVGWEVADAAMLDSAAAELTDAGIEVVVADEATARNRAVREMVSFEAPGGHWTELSYGAAYQGHFVSPLGVKFRTGALGMGHVVLSVPPEHYEKALAFYVDVMGFGVSEFLDFDPIPIQGALMHCGPRHHSLGIVRGGKRPGCDHIMIEASDADDVGRAWDRVLCAGVEIRRMIGRHSDDGMFSFYAATPSKIGIEFGSGGRVIDPDTWMSETLRKPAAGDVWGHQPPAVLAAVLPSPEGHADA